jgi:hypothetical protein
LADVATAQIPPPDQGLYPTLIANKGPLYQAQSLPLDNVDSGLQNDLQLKLASTGPIDTPQAKENHYDALVKAGNNNPGNIKTIGPDKNLIYASYNSPDAGIAAIGDWGVRAQQTHGLTTVRQLIDDPTHGYAPQADPGNRGKPLVKEASERMGVSPDEPIDLTNPVTRQKWTDAILAQEGHGGKASVGSLDTFQQSHQQAEQLIGQQQQQLDSLLKQLGSSKGDTQERRRLLQDSLDRSRSLQDQMLQLAQNPPTKKPTDLMSTFGSLAMLIGAIGGLKSRQPATAALEAAAGVIEGVNTNNEQEFDRNFKVWQSQSKLLSELTGIQAQDFREILENDRLDESERHNQLEEALQKWGMQESLDKLHRGLIEDAWKGPYTIMQANAQLDHIHAQTEEALARKTKIEQETALGGKVEQFIDTGTMDAQGHPTVFSRDAHGNTFKTEMQTDPSGETRQVRIPFNPVSPSKIPTTSAVSAADPEAVKNTAQMISNYQLAPMSGWAMKSPYGQQVMKTVKELNPNYSEPEYRARVAGEQTVGRRGATLVMASNAADQLIPIVEDLSKKVKRTDFPDINTILIAGKTKVGNPDTVAFGQGLNSLLYVYMRALNPSGIPRVADLERGEHMLQTSWSQGQLDSVLTQMKREIGAEKTAIHASSGELGSLFGSVDATLPLAGHDAKFDNKQQVLDAIDRGDLTDDQARDILVKQFGGKLTR